jgi:cyclic beta-1,2-glucan synthetase
MADRTMTERADPAAAVARLTRGDFTTLVSSAGAGMASLGEFALTRWAPDRTRDAEGIWLYVRDRETGAYWGAGLQPVPRRPDAYEATLGERRARLVRRDGDLELTTEVCIAPEGDAELRRYTLVNHGARPRRLELTTYAEAVLNTPMGDWSHPAFSKLFVQTEWDAAGEALVARRRLRSPEDEPLWLVHRLVGEAGAATEHETDRMRFVGRGRTTANPKALETGRALSGTVGNVLDPVLALRQSAVVEPGATVRLLAVLGAAHTREGADQVAGRYASVRDADAAFAGPSRARATSASPHPLRPRTRGASARRRPAPRTSWRATSATASRCGCSTGTAASALMAGSTSSASARARATGWCRRCRG